MTKNTITAPDPISPDDSSPTYPICAFQSEPRFDKKRHKSEDYRGVLITPCVPLSLLIVLIFGNEWTRRVGCRVVSIYHSARRYAKTYFSLILQTQGFN